MTGPCPLCGGESRPLLEDVRRGWSYAECPGCGLAFRSDTNRLTAQEEKDQYLLHDNRPSAGYEAFLKPAADAVAARCAPGSEGLDYGCGPGPVLALMLGERGFKTALYDPHFAASGAALERCYAFIVCTEAAEHFTQPAREFERLAGLLEPGGVLVLMTQLRVGADFESWRYRLDPTHLLFYGERTLAWLAHRHGWRLERPTANLAVLIAPV